MLNTGSKGFDWLHVSPGVRRWPAWSNQHTHSLLCQLEFLPPAFPLAFTLLDTHAHTPAPISVSMFSVHPSCLIMC